RFVRRKGQDMLIKALPLVHREVPDAMVLLVGDGPERKRLERLARMHGVAEDVVFAGAHPWEDLPPFFAAGDVFAMPCRTRKFGFEVEGLGIVFLEAAATGLPVIAGDSGGAPDAVQDGATGHVVDGRSPGEVASRVTRLLREHHLARRMGADGREWVVTEWRWHDLAGRLEETFRPREDEVR
ncbi:MAG TPA: glycosyltransferase, partial [Tepidiformaceae bacterium]|nr:glycosyltransferase [Tepidiformaceae bacterium]